MRALLLGGAACALAGAGVAGTARAAAMVGAAASEACVRLGLVPATLPAAGHPRVSGLVLATEGEEKEPGARGVAAACRSAAVGRAVGACPAVAAAQRKQKV